MFKLILIFQLLISQEPDYPKRVLEINETYQKCLDEGKFMKNCSLEFYSQMDELMGLILLDFRENESKEKSDYIHQNQKEWEVKIQSRFDKINQRLDSVTANNGSAPQDEVMFADNERAQIIEERIVELIKLLD